MKNRLYTITVSLLIIALFVISCSKKEIQHPTLKKISETEFKFHNEGINKNLPEFEKGVVHFKLKPSGQLRFVARNTNPKLVRTKAMERVSDPGYYKMLVFPGSEERIVNELKYNPNVEWAEPSYIAKTLGIPDDTYWNNGSQYGLLHINMPQVWESGNFGNKQIYAAITDEGIFSHDDLCGNIWKNPFELDNGIDDDGNGYIDDFHGWNWHDNNNQIYVGGDAHGTHVAGIAGARSGNQIGVASVNPNIILISLKFLQGFGSVEDAAKGLDYITDLYNRHGIKVTANNNSWGGGAFSQLYMDAVKRAGDVGILNVYAAGNANNNNDVDPSPSFPGAYTHLDSSMISVIATDWQNNKTSFSSYGQQSSQIGAPGAGIVSTVPTEQHTSSYAFFSGTSMAAPFVTGGICLYQGVHMELFSLAPRARAQHIKDALLNSATSLPQLMPYCRNGKFLNVASFLGQTAEHQPPFFECPVITPDQNPPSIPLAFEVYEIGFDPTPGAFYGGYAAVRWQPSIDPEGSAVTYYLWINGIPEWWLGGTNYVIAGIDDTSQAIPFWVQSRDAWGNTSPFSNADTADWSNSSPPPPPPPPPPPVEYTITTELNALQTAFNPLTVTLNWVTQTNGNISSIRVERKKNTGNDRSYKIIGSPPVNATSFVDDDIPGQGPYTYRITITLIQGPVGVDESPEIKITKK